MTTTFSAEPSCTKRKRVEQDEVKQSIASTSQTYKRPAKYWLSDGNIVLQVEGFQFRVHQSILRLHSSAFDSILSLPRSQNAPVVEGCPLVYGEGDTAQDWQVILMLIYYPLVLVQPLSVSFLKSMLRLGKKYQFDLIRNKAVKVIKSHIPSTFDSWKALLDPLVNSDEKPSAYSWIRGQEFDLINIASEVGFRSILPALYYLCAVNMEVDYIFDGLPRSDGTTSHLPPASQRAIFLGQSQIRDLVPRQTMAWLFEDKVLEHDGCLTPIKCPSERIRAMKAEVPSLALDLRNALNGYGYLINEPDFCASCFEKVQKLQDEARSKVWTELPLLFGLPKWDDIKDFVV